MTSPRVPFIIKGPSFADGVPSKNEVQSFRDGIADAQAAAFFDYWLSKIDKTIPQKCSIDPTEIPKLLAGIFVEEWDEKHQQSRIRLAGEFHREPDDSSIKGRILDDLAEGETRDIWRRCDTYNFVELRPTVCGYNLNQFSRDVSRHADLSLPVIGGAETILVYGYSWLI